MAWTNKGASAAAIAAILLAGAGATFRATAQTTGDTSGQAATSVDATTGAQVYGEICQACHMANAEGGTGAAKIPALAKNAHLADPDFVVTILVKGKGGMPAFAELLEPEQIAAVANHVRTHFGNDYPAPITAGAVKQKKDGGG